MAVKKSAYSLEFRDSKQKTEFEKICRANDISMRYALLKLIDEFNVEKRRAGLMP